MNEYLKADITTEDIILIFSSKQDCRTLFCGSAPCHRLTLPSLQRLAIKWTNGDSLGAACSFFGIRQLLHSASKRI